MLLSLSIILGEKIEVKLTIVMVSAFKVWFGRLSSSFLFGLVMVNFPVYNTSSVCRGMAFGAVAKRQTQRT